MALTQTQDDFLAALRTGDADLLKVKNGPSPELLESFQNFYQFISDVDHIPQNPRDRYISVERTAVLTMLKYASDRNCLGLQYCYGFDKPVTIGGQMQLINKGTIVDHPLLSEEAIYNSDFQVRNSDGQWQAQYFNNFSLGNILSNQIADAYKIHFKNIYQLISPASSSFLTGSLFPVTELKSILNQQGTPLGDADFISFRWGITEYETNIKLGKFILAIGLGDVTTGPVIERSLTNGITDPLDSGDCPPRPPC